MSAIPFDPNRTPSWKQHNQNLDKHVPVTKKRIKDLGVVDPWDTFGNAPEYEMGQLPKVFEDYVQDNIAEYGGDPAAYACGFLAMHVGVLHSSVEMQTRPTKDNWRAPNEHSLTLGKSGSNKSGLFKDLTKHQVKWQSALHASAPKRRGPQPPAILLTDASVEGMLRQVADNKGERLTVANDEAMGFFVGAGAHHQKDGVSTMSTAVCKMYDCEPFQKRLVNEKNSYNIPKLCGTLIMATVFDKFSMWESFPDLVSDGMLARFTVGLISNPVARHGQYIPGADKAMADQLFKLRALKDVRFALDAEAAQAWGGFINDKEGRNALLDEQGQTGLSEWSRKYDTRIISMASVLQAYEYTQVEEAARVHETFEVPKVAADLDKVGGDEARVGKLVRISYENLSAAIDFVEGFLYQTQEYFYSVAGGATEFGKELKNWIARQVTMVNPDDEAALAVTRNELTNQGPMAVRARNGINDKVKEKQRRWIRALLDHGLIEVYSDKPGARKFSTPRKDDESPNYRIRQEMFTIFENRRVELKQHDDTQQGKLAILRERLPLRLKRPEKSPSPEGEGPNRVAPGEE